MVPSSAVAGEEVDADEVGDVAGPGLGGDVGERAGLHDAPAFEDDDAVGQGVGVDGVVGDEQADAVEGGEVAAQVAADVAAGAGVEGGERLVEQEQAGLGGQRPGQRDPLRLAAGQRRGRWPAWSARPTRSSHAAARARAAGLGDAPGAQPEGDVLERGEVGEQQVVLEHHGDRTALRGARRRWRRGRRGTRRRARCGRRRWAGARPGSGTPCSCRRRSGRGRRRPPRAWRRARRRARTCRASARCGRSSVMPAGCRRRGTGRAGRRARRTRRR